MASEVQRGAGVPEVEDGAVVEFVVGFPCSKFGCHGTLRADTHRGRTGVRCSVCSHLYCVLTPE